MWIVQNRKVFYLISAILVGASLIAVVANNLKLGIDFTGGTLIEVSYEAKRPEMSELRPQLDVLLSSYTIQPTGERAYLVRTGLVSQEDRENIIQALSVESAPASLQRLDQIGPTIGREAAYKSMLSLGLVILLIVFYIAFAFRKVSEPVPSWKYGLIAIVALIHDVIVPTGVFAILGYEVGTLFVTALLVVLGFSVHDTIVVFDRVRENLRLNRADGKKTFETVVGESVSQTITRSVNTSLTVFITLLALFFFGGESIRQFVLALLIGVVAGTYSSIFLGSPLLVTVEKWQRKK